MIKEPVRSNDHWLFSSGLKQEGGSRASVCCLKNRQDVEYRSSSSCFNSLPKPGSFDAVFTLMS